MSAPQLTRESNLDGWLHSSDRALLGPEVRLMTAEGREAQFQNLLAQALRPDSI